MDSLIVLKLSQILKYFFRKNLLERFYGVKFHLHNYHNCNVLCQRLKCPHLRIKRLFFSSFTMWSKSLES